VGKKEGAALPLFSKYLAFYLFPLFFNIIIIIITKKNKKNNNNSNNNNNKDEKEKNKEKRTKGYSDQKFTNEIF
jgi:hypothetical protein